MLFVSCTQHPDQSELRTFKLDIKAETSEEQLPEVSITDIIALDSNEEALFGSFKWHEIYKDRFFYLSQIESNSLFSFSTETGQLIAKAKRGKGPGEIGRPTSCYIDKEKDNILVYDEMSSQVFIYDLDLNLLSKRQLIEDFIDDFILLESDMILTRSDFTPDYNFRLYSADNEILSKYVEGPEIRDGSFNLLRSMSTINKNEAYLITPFDYNIYKYKRREIENAVHLDFGNYKLTSSDLKMRFRDIIGAIRNGSKVISPMSISTSDNDILIRVFHGNDPIYYLLNLNNDNVILLNDLTRDAKLPEFIDISIMDDGSMYGLVEPLELKKFIGKSDGDFSGDFDYNPVNNPFLVKFRLL
jgi:hypothetical protein